MAWHDVAALINLRKAAISSAKLVGVTMFTFLPSVAILCKPVLHGCSGKTQGSTIWIFIIAIFVLLIIPWNQSEHETINICTICNSVETTLALMLCGSETRVEVHLAGKWKEGECVPRYRKNTTWWRHWKITTQDRGHSFSQYGPIYACRWIIFVVFFSST